ncbi:MAG: cytochrome b5-like heme/steroid binding domain-containing protein [Candidatus Falkowbacteria bacterium]
MKKTYLFLIIPAFLVFLTGCGNKNLTNSQSNTASGANTTNTTKYAGSLTMADVALHNSKTDCWQLINGQVYDLSSYTSSGVHPGGDVIVQGCGTDATAAFEAVGKHNGKAMAMLPTYLLGPLQK